MEIRSLIEVSPSTLETAGLKPGDRLRVRVVGLEENGRALIEIGRWRVTADIRFPVTAGEELWVRVLDTENKLSLQLARSPSDETSPAPAATGPVKPGAVLLQGLQHWLQQMIAEAGRRGEAQPPDAGLRQALESLVRCLAPIDPGQEPATLARSLARRVEEGGLFLEGRLLSLKAFSETVVGAALMAQDREFAALMRAAGAVLTEIRSAQEQLVRQAGAPDSFQVIHVALPMTDDRAPGTLKVAYRGGRPGGEKEGHRASLLLSLDRLGAVRADLLLLQRSLSVAVFVSDPLAREWVERHLNEVRGALALFFDNVGVQVAVSKARIDRFATEDDRPAGEGRVDVRV
ncbi:MAG: hypothetical protein R6V84_12370 [Desulfobacterales bacterium]